MSKDIENERRWTVYIHTVPKEINGYDHNKYYVGITGQKPIERRYGVNGSGYHDTYFYRAIQKYGWDNIKHEILAENLTKSEACNLEKYYINRFKSYDKNIGYNRTLGGEGGASVKIKNIAQYDFDGNLVNIYTSHIEASEKIGNVEKGLILSSANGKRKSAYGYMWRFFNNEPLQKIESYWESNESYKPILQYDLHGNFIREWRSIKEVQNILGYYSLGNVCNGRERTAYGYQWRYKGSDIYVCDVSSEYNYNTHKKIYCYSVDGKYLKEYMNVYEVLNCFNIDCDNNHKQRFINICKNNKEWNGYLWSFKKKNNIYPAYINNIKSFYKPIVKLDLNGNIKDIFVSVKDAAIHDNKKDKSGSYIVKCCDDFSKIHNGHKWKYIQDIKESDITDPFLLQKFKLITQKLNELHRKDDKI